MMFFWRRLDRFTLKIELIDKNRELTSLGSAQLTIDTNDVAQIKTLRKLPVLFTNLILTDEQLDLPRRILDVNEAEFASGSLEFLLFEMARCAAWSPYI